MSVSCINAPVRAASSAVSRARNIFIIYSRVVRYARSTRRLRDNVRKIADLTDTFREAMSRPKRTQTVRRERKREVDGESLRSSGLHAVTYYRSREGGPATWYYFERGETGSPVLARDLLRRSRSVGESSISRAAGSQLRSALLVRHDFHGRTGSMAAVSRIYFVFLHRSREVQVLGDLQCCWIEPGAESERKR